MHDTPDRNIPGKGVSHLLNLWSTLPVVCTCVPALWLWVIALKFKTGSWMKHQCNVQVWPKWQTLEEDWIAFILIRRDSPALRAWKWAWLRGSGQMLLKKSCSLHVLHALSLPSCHTSALWRALTGLGCRELKAFAGSLYRAVTPHFPRFPV